MTGEKAPVNRQKLENPPLLGFQADVDALSELEGNRTVARDLELLKPFLSQRKSDPQPSEAEIFQELIAEGRAGCQYLSSGGESLWAA